MDDGHEGLEETLPPAPAEAEIDRAIEQTEELFAWQTLQSQVADLAQQVRDLAARLPESPPEPDVPQVEPTPPPPRRSATKVVTFGAPRT